VLVTVLFLPFSHVSCLDLANTKMEVKAGSAGIVGRDGAFRAGDRMPGGACIKTGVFLSRFVGYAIVCFVRLQRYIFMEFARFGAVGIAE
jgi:hypothetical protein